MDEKSKQTFENENSQVDVNQQDSTQNKKLGQVELQIYDQLFPHHEPEEDLPEESSTNSSSV